MRKANFNQDSYLQQFGIAVNTQMTDVQGRVLNPPKILYGGWVCTAISDYHYHTNIWLIISSVSVCIELVAVYMYYVVLMLLC